MQSLQTNSNSFSEIETVSAEKALTLFKNIASQTDLKALAQENIKRSQIFLEQAQKAQLILARYQEQEQIVCLGNLVSNKFSKTDINIYAPVPLGIILKGEIIVLKEGKATKRLLSGDFIGLFETAYYLHLHSTRRIGNWSLTADCNTEILFFADLAEFKHANKTFFLQFQNYLVETARGDLVPQPITDLPLLDWIAAKVTKNLLDDTFIIAHTHILPTSLGLFRQLAHLVGYQNMLVMEKPYSTSIKSHSQPIL